VIGQIFSRSNRFLGITRIELPRNVVGEKVFAIRHCVYEYINGEWIDIGIVEYDRRIS
jgi:hypothetical protein